MDDRQRAVERLRDAIEALAADRAPALVEEARAEAEARVRARLSAAFEAELLGRAGEVLRERSPAASTRPMDTRTPRSPAPASSRPTPEPKRPAPEPKRPAPQSKRRAAGGKSSEEFGFYLYGVASAEKAEVPSDLPGVDPEHSAKLIEHHGLVAIVSRVSLTEFGEEPLHENLNDVEWLEAKARAHEHVLDQVMARAPVVPMRLCTIYRSEGQVREVLEREYGVFTDALERLEGKTEWGVKLIAQPDALDRAVDASAEEQGEAGDGLSAGAAYMREKSRAARRRELADRIAEGWAEHVHERVAAHAVEALLNPLQNPDVSGHVGDMLLNGVYLVEDERANELAAVVEELAAHYAPLGATVELTGPWPPYNFVKGSIEAAR